MTPRALTIATSDSGGGAGIQADLKAFAAAGAYGMSVLVALTAQNTVGVTAIHELPPAFVRAQLDAVFDDIGVDAAKTGMLFSRTLIETVADYLEDRGVTLVVDPVLVASSGAKLLEDDAVEVLVGAAVPARDRRHAEPARSRRADEGGGRKQARAGRAAARARCPRGDRHGRPRGAGRPSLRRATHTEIPVVRHDVAATHGAGCTHSATLAALLARGESLLDAARGAAAAASRAVAQGLAELGSGDGPVDVLGVKR